MINTTKQEGVSMTYHPPTDSFGFLLGQTHRKVSHLTNTAFKPYDITAEQRVLLLCLRTHNGITQTELSERAGKDKTTVTRLLDILERKEMIVKREHEGDRRAFLIELTEVGERVAAKLIQVEERVMQTVLEGLDAQAIAMMKEGLKKAQMQAERAMIMGWKQPQE
jgi:DNA-binding MarR family transcriptional regulator